MLPLPGCGTPNVISGFTWKFSGDVLIVNGVVGGMKGGNKDSDGDNGNMDASSLIGASIGVEVVGMAAADAERCDVVFDRSMPTPSG